VLESLYKEYQNVGDGLLVVQLLGQNFNHSNNVTVADLTSWITYIKNNYSTVLTYFVAADPGYAVGDHFNNTGYIPYYWLIDQNKVIYWKSLNLNSFETRIQTLLTD
jgi:hypothetical protein